MRVWVGGLVTIVIGLTGSVAGQAARTPDSAQVAAVQALLDLDPAQAWRTDVWTEGGELVLRMTPAAPAAELARVRAAAAPGPVARARFDAAGHLDRLSVRDARRAGAQVRREAPASERAAALRTARFAGGQQDDLVAASVRRWAALGRDAAITSATLDWRAAEGDRERAVWRVRLTTLRDGVPATFVVSLDPVDGSLLDVAREAAR